MLNLLGRDFEQIGGYNEDRLFAEDVQFMLELRRLASTQSRRLTFGTRTKAIFSTRKFDKYGEWHYLAVPFRVAWNLLRRRSFAISDWARRYWYEER